MDNQIIIEGIVSNIVFHNPENGYTVFYLETEYNDNKNKDDDVDIDDEIACVGTIPTINEGENIKVTGSFVVHPSYGKQISVLTYEKTIPTTEKGIERYLASGVIKGIGPKIANKIVSEFGTETLDVLENEPERLSVIRGISRSKAISIGEIFHEQTELRKAMLYLQDFGISPVYALKIYKKFKENTLYMVQKNPYILADEIFGIGFKMADAIAEKVGFEKESKFRIESGIKFILNREANNGNTYLPMEKLKLKASELLLIAPEVIENTVLELNITKQVWVENDDEIGKIVFLNSYFYSESSVARKLVELSLAELKDKVDYNKEIAKIEKDSGITLAKQQKLAVMEAMQNGVLVITGGPGTGKTTTINTIIKLLQTEGYEISLAAPTGRAAKRMTETTGLDAQTIHRLLGINFITDDSKKQSFEKDEDNPIEADVIIIDESSMVDITLMYNLLKAIPYGTRLILVGDVDQLPSVGPGNVLKDIINSGCIKVVRLNEIFRQAEQSAIVMNAHRINNGEYPVLNEKEKDFFFMKRFDSNRISDTILELITTRLPKYLNCERKEIQILTPMRKSPLGTTNLNAVIQATLNPKDPYKSEKEFRKTIFREGDKVMQIKNNYNMTWTIYDRTRRVIDEGIGIFNGDEGIIERIDNDSEYIEVLFDDLKVVKYDFTQLDELELSYAITIHKSQGSEYRAIVIPIYNGPDMLLNRNLIYTAVTRAKELAVLVGIPDVLYRMIDNNKQIDRYTQLKKRIIEMKEVTLSWT